MMIVIWKNTPEISCAELNNIKRISNSTEYVFGQENITNLTNITSILAPTTTTTAVAITNQAAQHALKTCITSGNEVLSLLSMNEVIKKNFI